MLHLFKPAWIKPALTLAALFFSAWAVTSFMKLFLPHLSVHYEEKSTFVARGLYRLSDALYEPQAIQEETQSAQTAKETLQAATAILDWKLKALYKEGREGFIVIVTQNVTHFLSLYESLEGYKLTAIQEQTATLEKGGKTFVLDMIESQKSTAAPLPPPPSINNQELRQGIVKRNHISEYMANPRLIWENIKIRPYKEAGNIVGFHVTYVKNDSVFEHLGLKANDLLVEANGVRLDSIEAAKELYKHINEIENLAMKVKRNGTLQELNYEIR